MPKSISLPLLLLLCAFAAFGAVLPAPAIPAIADYFNISTAAAEQVMSVFLLGYALGQLLYGPLANRYGRKSALMIGVVMAIGGGILGIVATYLRFYELYVVARFITALGSAAGFIIGMILIKDTYDDEKARKIFALVILAFSFVPTFAMALGGSLTHYFGWQSLNDVVLIYAIVVLVWMWNFQETFAKEKRIALSVRNLFNAYRYLLTHLGYLRLVMLFSLGAIANYIFNSIAPIIAIKTLDISAEMYGWLSIIPAIGMFVGAGLSARLTHIKPMRLIICGMVLIAISGVSLLLEFYFGWVNLIGLYITAVLMFCGTALISPNASMHALAQITDHANGASVMSATALGLTGIAVLIAGNYISSTILVLPIALIIIAIIGGILTYRKTPI